MRSSTMTQLLMSTQQAADQYPNHHRAEHAPRRMCRHVSLGFLNVGGNQLDEFENLAVQAVLLSGLMPPMGCVRRRVIGALGSTLSMPARKPFVQGVQFMSQCCIGRHGSLP